MWGKILVLLVVAMATLDAQECSAECITGCCQGDTCLSSEQCSILDPNSEELDSQDIWTYRRRRHPAKISGAMEIFFIVIGVCLVIGLLICCFACGWICKLQVWCCPKNKAARRRYAKYFKRPVKGYEHQYPQDDTKAPLVHQYPPNQPYPQQGYNPYAQQQYPQSQGYYPPGQQQYPPQAQAPPQYNYQYPPPQPAAEGPSIQIEYQPPQ